jgi:hypothetical protein
MIDRWFFAHPRAIGESYAEHAGIALRFGGTMVLAGAACLIHAVVPALFTRTASETVKRLYGQMRARQPDLAQTPPDFSSDAWRPEYEI